MAWSPSFLRSTFRRRADAAVASRWLESTLTVARFERLRQSGRRWGTWGGLLGAVVGVVLFAPASWLASAVNQSTAGRLVLADAQGTVWSGDAVAVLTGGVGSREARALPGRLNWAIRPQGWGLSLSLSQDCCIPASTPLTLRGSAGWRRWSVQVLSDSGDTVQALWPAAWLTGLGTPWNTLDLQGRVRLVAEGLTLEGGPTGLRVKGRATVGFVHLASRVTTLESLGSYTLTLQEQPPVPGLSLDLRTDEGALQLQGTGTLGAQGLTFRGQARAAPAAGEALNNLLNIIGRRQGELSVISIG